MGSLFSDNSIPVIPTLKWLSPLFPIKKLILGKVGLTGSSHWKLFFGIDPNCWIPAGKSCGIQGFVMGYEIILMEESLAHAHSNGKSVFSLSPTSQNAGKKPGIYFSPQGIGIPRSWRREDSQGWSPRAAPGAGNVLFSIQSFLRWEALGKQSGRTAGLASGIFAGGGILGLFSARGAWESLVFLLQKFSQMEINPNLAP